MIKLIDIIIPTRTTIILVAIKSGFTKESLFIESLSNKNKIPFPLDSILFAYLI